MKRQPSDPAKLEAIIEASSFSWMYAAEVSPDLDVSDFRKRAPVEALLHAVIRDRDRLREVLDEVRRERHAALVEVAAVRRACAVIVDTAGLAPALFDDVRVAS